MLDSIIWVSSSNCATNLCSSVDSITRHTAGTLHFARHLREHCRTPSSLVFIAGYSAFLRGSVVGKEIFVPKIWYIDLRRGGGEFFVEDFHLFSVEFNF